MANKKHLEILKRGVDAWNEWRKKTTSIKPDLRAADLSRANFRGANLILADLRGADLSKADLRGANLSKAYLNRANLRAANLRSADLLGTNLRGANLRGADLSEAYLGEADLSAANLRSADLLGTNLSRANLGGADLSRAYLGGADLNGADLDGADLNSADLDGADLSKADLSNVDLAGADLGSTIFFQTDLNSTKNLETCNHSGPSSIDQTTLIKSGKLPEKFLRGCGLSDEFIEYIPSLFWEKSPIEFYSCFISYSSKDEEFAKRLHADLQDNGVRCWFAPENLKVGDPFQSVIDQSIKVYDKLLVVISADSIESKWVGSEVNGAFEKERNTNEMILFPIRLDQSVMETKVKWASKIQNTRTIGDFTNWKDHDSYQKAFKKLLGDLRGEKSS